MSRVPARNPPVLRDIVLIGGGHSHVAVLRMFGMRPPTGVRLTLVCRDTATPYSGMLPGYIAGHYGFDDAHIDLRRLTRFAGARFVHANVTGIDRAAQRIEADGHPGIAYDLASINIGSTPRLDEIAGGVANGVPVKPIAQFNEHWLALLDRVRRTRGPLAIAVVGAGAGGVEILLAMRHRLRREREARGENPDGLAFHLLDAGDAILPTHNAHVRAAFTRILAERGVVVHHGSRVVRAEPGFLATARGATIAADEVVWVTRAGGAAWLADTGLALDSDGFIRVHATLQSVADPAVFAAGDAASIDGRPLAKAGVFAVRMGPVLGANLHRAALGQPLAPFRARRHWLALISTGERRAVASYGPWCAAGGWVWRWKDWIDRRFMRRFEVQAPMP